MVKTIEIHTAVSYTHLTKYYEAKKAGASFICKINNLSGITMKETDIILLLSNLLNNAIEAVEKCLDKKMIKVKIVIENNKFIVSVWNTFIGEIKREGDILKTTKKENAVFHGIGLKNVVRIAEKDVYKRQNFRSSKSS